MTVQVMRCNAALLCQHYNCFGRSMPTGPCGSFPERQAEVKPTNNCCVCCHPMALTCAGEGNCRLCDCVITRESAR